MTAFIKKYKFHICVYAVCIVGAGVFGYYALRHTADIQPIVATATPSIHAEEDSSTPEQTAEPVIMAHIFGAVVNPGVYELPLSSRIIDLIDKAGGFTDDAAHESVNQSEFVNDTAYIRVKTRDEWVAEPSLPHNGTNITENRAEESSLININTAGLSELMTLPGIGEVTARNIIDYREKNGSFRSIDELKRVSRIGDSILERIIDFVTVE